MAAFAHSACAPCSSASLAVAVPHAWLTARQRSSAMLEQCGTRCFSTAERARGPSSAPKLTCWIAASSPIMNCDTAAASNASSSKLSTARARRAAPRLPRWAAGTRYLLQSSRRRCACATACTPAHPWRGRSDARSPTRSKAAAAAPWSAWKRLWRATQALGHVRRQPPPAPPPAHEQAHQRGGFFTTICTI